MNTVIFVVVAFVVVAFVLLGVVAEVSYALYLRGKAKPAADGPDQTKVALALNYLCQLYEIPVEKLPRITWVTGSKLGCHGGQGWLDATGQCVAGESWCDTNASAIAWWSGATLAASALPHEAGHWLLWLQGREDPTHQDPIFAPGGLVDQGRALLRTKQL